MARTARTGESVGGRQNDANLAVRNFMNINQGKGSALLCRRSLRLKGNTAMCELEAANAVFFSQKHQRETSRDDGFLSTKEIKVEWLQCKGEYSPQKQTNHVEVTDRNDDESNLTLRDLQLRCKIRKRKAYTDKTAVSTIKLVNDKAHTTPMEEDIELGETILFMKEKMTRSSPTSRKRRKYTDPMLNSSSIKDKTLQIKSDEVSAASQDDFEAETDNLLEEMEPISQKNSQNIRGAESAFHVNKAIDETWFLDGSYTEKTGRSSTFAFINDCGFDSGSSCEMLEEDRGKELACEQPDTTSSNIMDTCASNLKEQGKYNRSLLSAPEMERCQIPSHGMISAEDRNVSGSSTQSKSIVVNMELLTKVKHCKILANGDLEPYEHHELHSEESVKCDSALLSVDAIACCASHAEADSEGILSSIANVDFVGNGNISSSDASFSKKMVSSASELKTCSSCDIYYQSKIDTDAALRIEGPSTSLCAKKQGNPCKKSILDAIDNNKSLEMCSTCDHGGVHGDYDELVKESMQRIPTCSPTKPSLIHCNTLDSNTLQCDGEFLSQHPHCCVAVTKYNGWAPIPDKMLPSVEGHLLNCNSENNTFNDMDYAAIQTDDNQDNIVNFAAGSSLEAAEVDAERKISNEHILVETFSADNQHMAVEQSPKKLPSNRKDISPNSQEKLLWALNGGGLDDFCLPLDGMNKLSFMRLARKQLLSLFSGDEESLHETKGIIKKPKIMSESLPQLNKGILKTSETICSNPCCSKESNHRLKHDAIQFFQRQMQDTEKMTNKLLKGLNSLKSIVQDALVLETHSSPLKFSAEELKLATMKASKLEETTKRWLSMMAKDCTRFCKIMELAENKLPSPMADLHKGRKKISFADEAGGMLCQVKVYEHQPVAFIEPKTLAYSLLASRKSLCSSKAC